MLGAIAGDIIGSVFEWHPVKHEKFPLFSPRSRFTDDTVLTVAVAHALLDDLDFGETIRIYANRYPRAGYGRAFRAWAASDNPAPYNSWGNGSAMRVSPTAYAGDDLDTVLDLAARSAAVTHNHPEGIKGAQAVAAAVFLARTGSDKREVRECIESRFGYDLSRPLDSFRPAYSFDVSCQGSVPEALIAFLESESFEDAVRKAVSLGGDADTQACIAGAVAEPFFGAVPPEVEQEVLARLDAPLREVVLRFRQRFSVAS